MIHKLKQHKYQLLELIIIFIITLLYNLICTNFTGDEIWNYGFAYNISSGLIPYKDFNMVITPLFPLLGSIFLTILGKSLLVYQIFNAIVCTMIFLSMKKIISNSYYLTYMIFLLNAYPSYNLLCMLLLYILMILEEKKQNDYIIGLFIGLTFLTKQNIGIYLCIPTLFAKNIKKILKRIIGFLIPNVILLIYLLYNDNLLYFIDYTILGLSSFAKQNLSINNIFVIIIIIMSLYLIYKYIKTRDIKIMYLIMFQLLAFPIMERYHIMIILIPIIGYVLNNIKVNKKIYMLIFIVNITITLFINVYSISNPQYTLNLDSRVYAHRKMPILIAKDTKSIAKHINTINDELYIISQNAYLIKLEANIKINKYDLLNNGNIGRDGEQKIINEIKENCQNKKCTFLVDLQSLSGTINNVYAEDIIKYIIINYPQKNRIEYLTVFQNY